MKRKSGIWLMAASALMLIAGLFCVANGIFTVMGHPFFAGHDLAVFAQDMAKDSEDIPDAAWVVTVVGGTCIVMGLFQVWAGIAGLLASQWTSKQHNVVTTLGVIGSAMAVFAFIAVWAFEFSFQTSLVTVLVGIVPFLYTLAAALVAPKHE